MGNEDVQVGDKVRFNSDWMDIEPTHRGMTVNKILEDVNSGERFAYLTRSPGNPETELIPVSDIGEDGDYEIVADE